MDNKNIWQRMSEKKKMKKEKLFSCETLIEPFGILTTTLLTLLLPISFLCLAKLSTERYLLAFMTTTSNPSPQPFSLFYYANFVLLHVLVSLVSITTLLHGLTIGNSVADYHVITSLEPISRPRAYNIWILLCTLLVCVGLGLEASLESQVDFVILGYNRSFLTRFFFFLGLHRTMLHWLRMVVKPMVSNTVFGHVGEERWVETVAIMASFGSLWWWRLRGEVESLVVVAEIKNEVFVGGVGVADFVAWWLYYLTVIIGVIWVVKGLVWIGMTWPSRRVVEVNPNESQMIDEVV